ncbi:hypothetical protein B0H16DRAFT_349595 [Mycena metata]|uniref:Uncharacterized protein n=1 Tax=Mycena metata TaxID=1033252 RepID=A0AAD7HK76_9AGAR|nr:hypothetical protein B0H16DRAFT_349595 [Mycena metata]
MKTYAGSCQAADDGNEAECGGRWAGEERARLPKLRRYRRHCNLPTAAVVARSLSSDPHARRCGWPPTRALAGPCLPGGSIVLSGGLSSVAVRPAGSYSSPVCTTAGSALSTLVSKLSRSRINRYHAVPNPKAGNLRSTTVSWRCSRPFAKESPSDVLTILQTGLRRLPVVLEIEAEPCSRFLSLPHFTLSNSPSFSTLPSTRS